MDKDSVDVQAALDAASKQAAHTIDEISSQSQVYQNLNGPGSIRLFELLPSTENGVIRGRLFQVDLLQKQLFAPSYAAVSYTWGVDNPRTDRQIEIDGHLFTVRQNLRDFLQTFSTSKLRIDRRDKLLLWIDAICIDQANIAERNHQVHLMKKIFASAQEVIVWLGLPDPDFSLITLKSSLLEGKHVLGHTKHTNGLLLNICGRDFWRRLWIVQEICVARDINILTQKATVPWDEFIDLATAHTPENAFIRRRLQDGPANSVIALRNWRQRNAIGKRLRLKSSMVDLLKTFSNQECHDPRDRVFGLLGLAETGDGYRIDYLDSPTAVLHKTLDHFAPEDDILPMAEMLRPALRLSEEAYLEQMIELRDKQLCAKYCTRSVTIHDSADKTSLKQLTMRRFTLEGRKGSIKQVCLCKCNVCNNLRDNINQDQLDGLLADDELFLYRVRFLKSTYILFRRAATQATNLSPVGCAEINPVSSSGPQTDFQLLVYATPDEMEVEMLPQQHRGARGHRQADCSISISSFMLCKVFFSITHARYNTLRAAWQARQTTTSGTDQPRVTKRDHGSPGQASRQSKVRRQSSTANESIHSEGTDDPDNGDVPDLIDDNGDPVD